MAIIRRNDCFYVTLGTCYSVWMTVWYAGCSLHTRPPPYQRDSIPDRPACSESVYRPSYSNTSSFNANLRICFMYSTKDIYVYINKCVYIVHNVFLVYLLLVYLSISTCFGRLCGHHQEKRLCLCDAWYLLFYVDNCLVRRVQPAYQTPHRD